MPMTIDNWEPNESTDEEYQEAEEFGEEWAKIEEKYEQKEGEPSDKESFSAET